MTINVFLILSFYILYICITFIYNVTYYYLLSLCFFLFFKGIIYMQEKYSDHECLCWGPLNY